jgi:DNA-binding CsgD family transcriptional regulator
MLERIMSEEAAALYWRLINGGAYAVDPDQDGLAGPEDELVTAGFAHLEAGLHTYLVPVLPAVAAQLVLQQLSDRIGEWHLEAARAVQQLVRFDRFGTPGNTPLAEIITEPAQITALVEDIQRSARRELLSFEIPIDAGSVCLPRLSPAADAPPPVWRTVYTTDYLVPRWRDIVDKTVGLGGQVRVIGAAPIKLLIADRAQALVPLDKPGVAGVVLFRAQVVIEALASLFEAIWERAAPYPPESNATDVLTPFERYLVTLLAAGLKDEAMAAQTHLSVRTIRRHVASILDKLDVTTRFAAGAQAAKRGWV